MNRRGFTLIELMTTIGIIVLLIGILLMAAAVVRQRALRVTAEVTIGQLHVALDNYRGEDLRHHFPLPLPDPMPFLRLQRGFSAVPDPTRPRSRIRPTQILDQLAECGLSWLPETIGPSSSAVQDCLLDPWRRPYRYACDDGSAFIPMKPAPQSDWNPSQERPYAYVWSLGRPRTDDLSDAATTAADNWIYRHDGKVH